MPLVSLNTVLKPAFENAYAVGSFNVINFEFIEAILETAESQNSPVILSLAEAHFRFLNPENICPSLLAMARRSRVPVALNLDHGMSLPVVSRAIRNGFTSAMFDGSKLDYRENVRKTREVVETCRPAGVSVEAELGSVGGKRIRRNGSRGGPGPVHGSGPGRGIRQGNRHRRPGGRHRECSWELQGRTDTRFQPPGTHT